MQQAYPLPEYLLAAVAETLRMLLHPEIGEVTVQEKGWKIVGTKQGESYSLVIKEMRPLVYHVQTKWTESS